MNKFDELGLAAHVAKALPDLGYEAPTPVQEICIPILMGDQDLLAQAQTGTGKTAAFALPILSKLDLKNKRPQALVLAPTRELAIQVAEAFQEYSKYCEGFHVLPIYGGQDYSIQLKALKRGVQVVIGTPGRVMDHLRRGTLSLDSLSMVVLDEADEMLKMGFIDDVKWILEQIPGVRQTALFSATIPPSIRNIANQYLTDARVVQLKPAENTLKNIQQLYVMVSRDHKIDALARIMEMEEFTAAIIFTRTKANSTEVADKLQARGYSAAAINGDMAQKEREKVIQKVKQGSLDIIVATEVAARGLDIDRLDFVINYDVPHDVDSYTHRIGRTGRAGRTGKALVFITNRETRMLKEIQHATKQEVKELKLPSTTQIKEKRLVSFADKITAILEQEDVSYYRDFIKSIVDGGKWSELDVAAAIAILSQKKNKADDSLKEIPMPSSKDSRREPHRSDRGSSSFRGRGDSFRGKESSGGKGGYRGRDSFKGKEFGGGKDGYKSKDSFKGKKEFGAGKDDGYKSKDSFKGKKVFGGTKDDGYKGKDSFKGKKEFGGAKDGYKSKDSFKGKKEFGAGKDDGYKSKDSFKGKKVFGGTKDDGYKSKDSFKGKKEFGGAKDGYKSKDSFKGKKEFGGAKDGYKSKDSFKGKKEFGGAKDGYKSKDSFRGKESAGSKEGYKSKNVYRAKESTGRKSTSFKDKDSSNSKITYKSRDASASKKPAKPRKSR